MYKAQPENEAAATGRLAEDVKRTIESRKNFWNEGLPSIRIDCPGGVSGVRPGASSQWLVLPSASSQCPVLASHMYQLIETPVQMSLDPPP